MKTPPFGRSDHLYVGIYKPNSVSSTRGQGDNNLSRLEITLKLKRFFPPMAGRDLAQG